MFIICIKLQALNYCKIKSNFIVNCYGITKFPKNGNYAIVLNRHFEGNLREYLQNNHSKLTLKNRISIFNDLCQSLYLIHEKDFIHCDLHSGNLLIEAHPLIQLIREFLKRIF